jgi:hypothetical protein
MIENTSERILQSPTVARAQRSLSTVDYDCGFHFYTAIGDYTGVTAVSLQDLAEKMRSISLRSVRFHFERGEFQRWIRTLLCDQKLAEGIGLIKPHLSDEALRTEIIARIEEDIGRLEQTAKRGQDWKPLLTIKYSTRPKLSGNAKVD